MTNKSVCVHLQIKCGFTSRSCERWHQKYKSLCQKQVYISEQKTRTFIEKQSGQSYKKIQLYMYIEKGCKAL